MKHARARLVALAVVVVAAASAAVLPASANAFVSYYDCVAKPFDLWCDGVANGSYDGIHSWDYNKAWSPSGVQVCQRVYKPSTGGVLSGNTCGTPVADHVYGNVQCICYEAQVKHRQPGANLNVNGFADADW